MNTKLCDTLSILLSNPGCCFKFYKVYGWIRWFCKYSSCLRRHVHRRGSDMPRKFQNMYYYIVSQTQYKYLFDLLEKVCKWCNYLQLLSTNLLAKLAILHPNAVRQNETRPTVHISASIENRPSIF